MPDESARRRLPAALRYLIRAGQILLYLPIQATFVPFAVFGLLDGIRKEMGIGRRLGVSFTAVQALQYRWIMHHFDTRPDPLSVAFTKKLPCESHVGLWATLGALIVTHKLFGFSAGLGELDEPGEATLTSTAGRRLLLFDRILETYVDEMEQIVIPGSGFDLIAQDFYSRAFVAGGTSMVVRRTLRLMQRMGEPWRFGIDMSADAGAAVESFLDECGWTMTEFVQFGEKRKTEPFYCIVEAEKR